jgi:hypothetical protein
MPVKLDRAERLFRRAAAAPGQGRGQGKLIGSVNHPRNGGSGNRSSARQQPAYTESRLRATLYSALLQSKVKPPTHIPPSLRNCCCLIASLGSRLSRGARVGRSNLALARRNFALENHVVSATASASSFLTPAFMCRERGLNVLAYRCRHSPVPFHSRRTSDQPAGLIHPLLAF